MSKIHFDVSDPSDTLPRALCGWIGGNVTSVASAVTCKNCQKKLRDTGPVALDPASRYMAQVEAGQRDEPWADVEGLPIVSPATWVRFRNGCACGTCPLCIYFRRIAQDEFAAPWKKTHRIFRDRARWSSVTAALETYVHLRVDGYSAGAWGHSLDVFRTLGVRVQADGATESVAERSADDAVEVERALRVAYDRHNSRGLDAAACVAVLLARVVGRLEVVQGRGGRRAQRYQPVPAAELAERLGVTASAVGGIVKSGRARVYAHLRERGLVEPKTRRRAA